jgi:acyl-CoA synthetase (AMP-forming)/AMP-acid ligase II
LRILDVDGGEAPPEVTGEIALRGPTVMVGYHRRDDLNAARRIRGWYLTNDLGRREADGSVSFIGPKSRLIKTGGENVYPAEVESLLRRHPAVQEAAVVGVPDPRWGQSVKAVVVPVADQVVTLEAIVEHCTRFAASYKKPRYISIVDRLPRHSDGRLDYDALDVQHGGGGYPGLGGSPSVVGQS